MRIERGYTFDWCGPVRLIGGPFNMKEFAIFPANIAISPLAKILLDCAAQDNATNITKEEVKKAILNKAITYKIVTYLGKKIVILIMHGQNPIKKVRFNNKIAVVVINNGWIRYLKENENVTS